MFKSLIKVNIEMRLEHIEDVKAMEEEVRNTAAANNYQISSYTWNLKEIKVKGEVVDEYYQVKYTCVFNDIKAPNTINDSVDFVLGEHENV